MHQWVVTGMLGLALSLLWVPYPTAQARPEGTMTWGVHVTLAPTWVDPAETPGIITPFMFLYALHDAPVKPMPDNSLAPSLAEAWSESADGLTYEFIRRPGITFHNGDPVTAEDVKFSFLRYKGTSARGFKERVRDVDIVEPRRVRFGTPNPPALTAGSDWPRITPSTDRRSTGDRA